MKGLNIALAKLVSVGALGVLGVLALLSEASAADIRRALNPFDQIATNGSPTFFILKPASGSDTLTINCPARCKAAILYNAECSVAATDTETFVDIDILVDGAVVPPSHVNDNSFCTSTGTNALDGWVSASINVGATLLPGSHAVRVRGTLRNFNAGERGWMDDISLIVIITP